MSAPYQQCLLWKVKCRTVQSDHCERLLAIISEENCFFSSFLNLVLYLIMTVTKSQRIFKFLNLKHDVTYSKYYEYHRSSETTVKYHTVFHTLTRKSVLALRSHLVDLHRYIYIYIYKIKEPIEFYVKILFWNSGLFKCYPEVKICSPRSSF